MAYGRPPTEYELRQARNAEATAVDVAAWNMHVETMDAFLTATYAVDDIAWPAHWTHNHDDNDDCEDYCRTCVREQVAHNNREHRREKGLPPRNETKPWYMRDDDGEEDPWSIDGGFDSESGPASCTVCGRMLDYSLDDSSGPEELDFFLDQRPDGVDDRGIDTAGETYELREVVAWVRDLGPSELETGERIVALLAKVDVDAAIADIPRYEASILETQREERAKLLAKEVETVGATPTAKAA